MITAKFGTKIFEVSSKKIYTPSGVSVSEELNIEETEVSGKKPTVSIKGVKLQPLSFDVKLDSRFVDVLTEIKFWKNTLLAKKSQNFSLGNSSMGKFFLTKYDLKSITINKNGVYTSALISLSFTEDGAATNSAGASSTPTTKKATAVKSSSSKSTALTIKVGATIKPKSGTRWYETAEGALKKSGKSGKAYQKNMTIKYIYKKSGKIVCVNPQGLGWMKVEDVTLVKATSTKNTSLARLEK